MTTRTTMNRARVVAASLLGLWLAVPAGKRTGTSDAVITGKVTSEFGQPIDQANVYINDLSISVGTNAQGVYTITIPAARVAGPGGQPSRPRDRLSARTSCRSASRPGTQTAELHAEAGHQPPQRSRRHRRVGRRRSSGRRCRSRSAASRRKTSRFRRSIRSRRSPARSPACASRRRAASPGSTPEIMLRGPTSINAPGRSQGPLIVVDGVDHERRQPRRAGRSRHRVGRSREGRRRRVALRHDGGQRRHRRSRRSAAPTQDGVKFNVRTEYGFSDLNSFDYGLPVNHHAAARRDGQALLRRRLRRRRRRARARSTG